LFDVPPSCFYPAPKVTSAVLRCKVRPNPAVSPDCGEEFFFRTVRAAFAQRRKTLVNSLSSVFPLPKDKLSQAIESAGLSPTVRGEKLNLEDFSRLADALFAALA
jgi:16S rRNA (adenine1518-N6/adenine1519-N6)-dimethyltransferase